MRLADTADIQAARDEVVRLTVEDKPLLADCLNACADTAELAAQLVEALRKIIAEPLRDPLTSDGAVLASVVVIAKQTLDQIGVQS